MEATKRTWKLRALNILRETYGFTRKQAMIYVEIHGFYYPKD